MGKYVSSTIKLELASMSLESHVFLQIHVKHGGPHFSSQEGGDASILVTIVAVG